MLCGFNIVGVSQGEMDRRKRTTIFIVVRFKDAAAGPPTSWVPPGVYPSPNTASSEIESPTSLWKGRGGCCVVRVSERGAPFVFGPTSLKRGEGPLSGLSRMVETEMGGKGKDGSSGMGAGRTKLNRDGVDGQFKLRSHSKITFDISVHWFDKKIKICVIF